MLDIKNMFKEDKLFNLMSRLQGWAQTKLWTGDFLVAMATTNCLVDYKIVDAISTTQNSKAEGTKKSRVEGKPPKKELEGNRVNCNPKTSGGNH